VLTAGILLVGAAFGAMLASPLDRAPARATPTVTATDTTSPTPTATPTATPEPVVYRVTWYGDDFAGGPMLCTEEPYDPNDPTVAASGAGGPPCGERLRLCSDAACIEVVIRDGCGGCGPRHLDLSRAGWHALGQPTEVMATPVPPVAVLPPPPALPVAGGSLAALPVPDGTTVIWGGCASDGTCYPYNFWWAPTREAVLQNGEGQIKVQHEICHGHQHWSINGGAPLSPSDYDIESWYSTPEGISFSAAAAGQPWPWTHSAINGLEDFAWTCAYWYNDPRYLNATSPVRYQWAQQNLP